MKTTKLTAKFELFLQYPSQSNPQPCYVELDLENGTLTADTNCEIGNAVPFAVWYGHVRRYVIPPLIKDCVNDLLDEIAPLAERVLAGYSTRWDGHNHIAYLTDDAQYAESEIERICDREVEESDDSNTVSQVHASDWLYDMKSEIQNKTDAEIDAIATGLDAEAESQNILVDDIVDTLRRWRDESREGQCSWC